MPFANLVITFGFHNPAVTQTFPITPPPPPKILGVRLHLYLQSSSEVVMEDPHADQVEDL